MPRLPANRIHRTDLAERRTRVENQVMTQREADKIILAPIAEKTRLNIRCPKHPKYKGVRRPTIPCIGCWEIYIQSLASEIYAEDYLT